MNNKRTKKMIYRIFISIYMIASFLQNFLYIGGNKVYAANNKEGQLDYTNIVAILVDNDIYQNTTIKSKIKWYATDYIQGSSDKNNNSISNSKALVLPIDKNGFSAKDISQILENLYFDGIQEEPSKLVGVILIGDIPLPVVNQDGYIYPTIYPYVDFENQKFIWDESSKYFIYNNNKNGQAEIRHGILNFDTENEYIEYFDKLENYWDNPENFIGKNIWYEDFIANNKYFNESNLNFYLNNFIFAEDLGYHRYSNLLLKILQGERNDEIADLMQELESAYTDVGFSGAIDFPGNKDALQSLSQSSETMTMFLETMLKNGYLSDYPSLFGQKYLKTIVNNVETSDRWNEIRTGSDGNSYYGNSLDTHYSTIAQKDEILLRMKKGMEPFMIAVNNALENLVDEKIEEEKYWLNEIIPLTYLNYESAKRNGYCKWKEYNAYENYIFGERALTLTNMEQASAYRGTYRNYLGIDGLTVDNIQNSYVPSTDLDIDLNKKSIGGSYDVLAQQTEGNRGYNTNNTIQEFDIYSGNKIAKRENWDINCTSRFLGICRKYRWSVSHTNGSGCDEDDQGGCENPQDFAIRNRGGASPLNLSGNDDWKSGYNFQDAIYPIFDIAGSNALSPIGSGEQESNSYLSIDKYSRLIQQQFIPNIDKKKYWSVNSTKKAPAPFGKGFNESVITKRSTVEGGGYPALFTNRLPVFNTSNNSIARWEYNDPLSVNDVNYFEKYSSVNGEKNKEGNIVKLTNNLPGGEADCRGAGEIYTYKTLDSRVKNDSPNGSEIEGSSHSMFFSDDSRVKQFYDEVVSQVDGLSGDINRIVGTDTGSLRNNLIEIKNNIDNINNGLRDIIGFNTNTFSHYNTGEIHNIANERKNVFSNEKMENLSGLIQDSQDIMLDFSGYIDISEDLFMGIAEYVESGKEKFLVNGWSLYFLSNRKTTLLSSISDIANNFKRLKTTINLAFVEYELIGNIGDISLLNDNVDQKLQQQKGRINMLQQLSGEYVGCRNKYRELCDALNEISFNYVNYAEELNNERDGINNLVIEEYDDEGENIVGHDTINNMFLKLIGSTIFTKIDNGELVNSVYSAINSISGTVNTGMIETIPGMNQTTFDRPIDSPKYITFKGIAGDEVSFIYPDLYKVEVFKGSGTTLELKSVQEISESIKQYLREVVNKYNEYLVEQRNGWARYYAQNAGAFNLIERLDALASPKISNRPYNLIDENYLIDRLRNTMNNNVLFYEDMAGLDPIDFIANMLYYQNMGWSHKEIGDTIQSDIDNQRTNYDINKKIDYILNNYLISDNDQGNFITPGYREEGYEVAYINSDGNDYIEFENSIPSMITTLSDLSSNYKYPEASNIERTQFEEELINECNIPSAGGVLLFDISSTGGIISPWRDAMKCRLEKTIEKPLTLKLVWHVSDEIFDWDWDHNLFFASEHNFKNNVSNELEDLGYTYMSQLNLLDNDEYNQNLLDESNIIDYRKLEKILSYTYITTENSAVNADNPVGTIKIYSDNTDLGNVEFHITNEGGSKIKLLNSGSVISNNITKNLGGNAAYISLNPNNGADLQYQVELPKDGLNVLVFHMCIPGTQDLNKCVKKSLRLDVVPGKVSNVKILAPSDVILEGSKLPIVVNGTDQYGNNVGELITERFDISASNGYLSLGGKTGTSLKFSNFDESQFNLNANGDNLDGKIIKLEVNGNVNGNYEKADEKEIKVIKGQIFTFYENEKINGNGISISLPDEDVYSYIDSNNLTQANLDNIPKIKVNLVDMQGRPINSITSAISISTKNGILNPGTIETKIISKNINGSQVDLEQKRFYKTNSITIQSGNAIIYLMPNFSAGNEVIYINMPGIDTIEIPVVVNPGNPKNIEIKANDKTLYEGGQTQANLKILDNWNNIVTDNTNIKIGVLGNINVSGLNQSSVIEVQGGETSFIINAKNNGGKGYIYSMVDGTGLGYQNPGVLEINVQGNLLPQSGLNIMYLNLYGDDRGNEWGYLSNNNKYVENLISNSKKLLSVTTQLVSQENIKYFPITIDNSLNLTNLTTNNTELYLNNGLVFDINNIGNIKLNKEGTTSFTIENVAVNDDKVEEYISAILNKKHNKNIIFYIPQNGNDVVYSEGKNNSLYVNNFEIFNLKSSNFDKNLSIKLDDSYMNWYQVWNVYYTTELIGKMIFVVNDYRNFKFDLVSNNIEYGISKTRVSGSTNNTGLGFYKLDSSLSNSTFGYKSIQDSYDHTLGIGFTSDFKNITNFGAGQSVGESTLPFSSELLINIGDPLLKRINKNKTAETYKNGGTDKEDTEFDLGLGEVIYSDPDDDIFKVINIDFNNDDLEDIIVVYQNGRIKLLKNYGGTDPYKDMGPLMVISDKIEDVLVGDVDGNSYSDLIIHTTSGKLRVYKNNGGIFDVDGYPVCINTNVKSGEISNNPDNVFSVNQIFFEDMDRDGSLDIITNDELGFIKIFYGGTRNGHSKYISENKYMCDEDWYDRLDEKIVYQFGIKIDETVNILDQSLVRRSGIYSGHEVLSDTDSSAGIDINGFDNIDKDDIPNVLENILGNYNVQEIENSYRNTERYKNISFGGIPGYESGANKNDIYYVEIGALTGSDPVKIYKKYENLSGSNNDLLTDGDLVKVSVVIRANQDFTGTFIDNIVGPRVIPVLEEDNNMLKYFWFGTGDTFETGNNYNCDDCDPARKEKINNLGNGITRDIDNFRYMVDNISLRSGETLQINYRLYYDYVQVDTIDVKDVDGTNYDRFSPENNNLGKLQYPLDKYPDIKVQPTDGCNDSLFIFFNKANNGNNTREYKQEYVDLAKTLSDYNSNSQENYQTAVNEFSTTIGDFISDGDASSLNNAMGLGELLETLDWKGILEDNFDLNGLDISEIINLPGKIIDAASNDVINDLDKTIGSLCNGISLSSLGLGAGNGCGLPVPFNQAFLGVGDYTLGCYKIDILTRFLGDGRPAMNIPGNRGVYPFPGIFGFPTRGATDNRVDFGGLRGGQYSSLFRLYLMPTLTLDLGVAMCFGDYNAGKLIVDPIGSIAGNCIVFSVPLPCGGSSSNNGNNTAYEVPDAYADMKSCDKQNFPLYLSEGESSTPFKMYSASANSNIHTPAIPEGSYAGGFLTFEKTPVSQSYSEDEGGDFDTNEITLYGGANSKNKIKGSKSQGLIEKVVKSWLDKQIKYIMANLTNFKISVAWPDFDDIFGKFPAENFEQVGKNFSDDWDRDTSFCVLRGMIWDENTKTCKAKTTPSQQEAALNKLDARSQNNLISREQVSNLSDSLLPNVFENLQDMFNDTPLVNISTKNYNIMVPMITSEDITSYVSLSQNRLNKQEDILNERGDFFISVVKFCGGDEMELSSFSDIGKAIDKLEKKYQSAEACPEKDDDTINYISNELTVLRELQDKYDLSSIGNYTIYEASDGGYYIKYSTSSDDLTILPKDVYLLYKNGQLTIFTKGYNLIIDGKKLKIESNGQSYSNEGLSIKYSAIDACNSCANLFLDGKLSNTFNSFFNIQTSASVMIDSVKQNIETLQLYQKFPLELYEWVHVVDRYTSEITSFINSFWGTLSMWMETNANRYSQYIDAIITIMTTLQTYQLIIDLSADWTENCSTCTNDNYDQFACKLGLLCPDNLPIIKIPSMKIPSLFIDFSNINLGTDIILPDFTFTPMSVPLPDLPDIPRPPQIDLSLPLDASLSLGTSILGKLEVALGIDLSLNLPSIPLIPSPPELPELPSYIPELQMELPLLPPAPKIPELPNEITASIKLAKVIGKILCIVKMKFGLVAEQAIKAKVEQITQRDYEVPYWDDFDLTESSRNLVESAGLPNVLGNIFTGFQTLLESSEFEDVQLKGFDLSLDTYVNLQVNFEPFSNYIGNAVGEVNKVSYAIDDFAEKAVNYVNPDTTLTDRLSACLSNFLTEACLGELYTEDVRQTAQRYEEVKNGLNNNQLTMVNLFSGLTDVLAELDELQLRSGQLQEEISVLEKDINDGKNLIAQYKLDVNNGMAGSFNRLMRLSLTIHSMSQQLQEKQQEYINISGKINGINLTYGERIKLYEAFREKYDALLAEYNAITQKLDNLKEFILNQINQRIKQAEQSAGNAFNNIGEKDDEIKGKGKAQNEKQELKKQQRFENLKNLYKDFDELSYIEYDKTVNKENNKILNNALASISDSTTNKDIKGKADEYISLLNSDKKISANTGALENIKRQYSAVLDNYDRQNHEIVDLIHEDYDEFLLAVADNSVKLVNNDDFNITLSANLFDMDRDTVSMLESKDSIEKMYIKYYETNIDGYLNALQKNDPQTLNMDETTYELNKSYLSDIKKDINLAYEVMDGNKKLIAQNYNGGSTSQGNRNNIGNDNTIDIATYIEGSFIKTDEGTFTLANVDYTKKFQGNSLLTDINKDGKNDLILRDNHNIYIKYRGLNTDYDNTVYNRGNRFYLYQINSNQGLHSECNDDGYIKIEGTHFKLCSDNLEVKNFEYRGEDFDSIRVSWSNSDTVGESISGYLVKLIHRVDQFNDNEGMTSTGKKYVLVLPKGTTYTGSKIKLEENGYNNKYIGDILGTGNIIFDVMYYNKNDENIALEINEIPRNWQYSEIYSLKFDGRRYEISSPSSNQIVSGPQIISDSVGPKPSIGLFRPSTQNIESEGPQLEGYVGTTYTLYVDWEDDTAINDLWISDYMGDKLETIENLNQKTGHIELSGLYFTGEENLTYFIGGTDINGNSYVTDVNLDILTPNLEIVKAQTLLNMRNIGLNFDLLNNNTGTNDTNIISITAQLSHDIDSGFVQFFRDRNDRLQLLTGIFNGIESNKFAASPNQILITGQYFDYGNDIGLYSSQNDMIAKINPDNGKITIMPGFENDTNIELDYSAKIPVIKVRYKGNIIFWIIFTAKELVELNTIDQINVQQIDGSDYGEFDGGKVLIKDGQILLYISKKGAIYTDSILFGDYYFDESTQSVKYTFKQSQNGNILGEIKIKIESLLENR